MSISTKKLLLLCLICAGVLLAWMKDALAWGGRGHHTVCDSATFLVKEEGLKQFLQHRPHIMGHLCNVPDIYWKNIDGKIRAVGDPTHYTDPEIIGLTPKDMPLDLEILIKKYTGTENQFTKAGKIFSVPGEVGTNWWRADQFARLATAEGKKAGAAATPKNRDEEQDEKSDYNKSVYKMMTYMGIMGHYVGDNGQPFHSTANYDGYATGHGGIHGYYEETVVSNLGFDLQSKVVKRGRDLQRNRNLPFLKDKTVLEKMRSLSVLSFADVAKVLKKDAVLKPSEVQEKSGMVKKTPAERKPPQETAKGFEPLIIEHMARSATLLAQIWEMIYIESGKPDLSKYRLYDYPFTPEFVFPDYYKEEKKN